MDLPKTLLRSVARSFYPTDQVLILDAVLLHSALRDDDLALLMGMQTKSLRKLAHKLREDGLLYIHTRPEMKPGASRPFNREYYYVHMHRAIDVIKFRLKSMAREVERKYGKAVDEKKEYKCPRCSAMYTIMEVLDQLGPEGFLCRRCSSLLTSLEDDAADGDGTSGVGAAGHEVQSRLNAQLAPFEGLLRKIDATNTPENDFESAIALALPILRDERTHPGSRSEPVRRPGEGLPPATVFGRKTEEKIEVSVLDEAKRAELEKQEAEERQRAKEQNALPTWHTESTVGKGGGGWDGIDSSKDGEPDGLETIKTEGTSSSLLTVPKATTASSAPQSAPLTAKDESKPDVKEDKEDAAAADQQLQDFLRLQAAEGMDSSDDDSEESDNSDEEEDGEDDEGDDSNKGKVRDGDEQRDLKRLKVEVESYGLDGAADAPGVLNGTTRSSPNKSATESVVNGSKSLKERDSGDESGDSDSD